MGRQTLGFPKGRNLCCQKKGDQSRHRGRAIRSSTGDILCTDRPLGRRPGPGGRNKWRGAREVARRHVKSDQMGEEHGMRECGSCHGTAGGVCASNWCLWSAWCASAGAEPGLDADSRSQREARRRTGEWNFVQRPASASGDVSTCTELVAAHE